MYNNKNDNKMDTKSNFLGKHTDDKKIIFIVEDNAVYAKSLQSFLQNSFPEVDEIKVFKIGEMCLLEMQRNPSIVIMDYILNSKYEKAQNGLEIIKLIKFQRTETNIILLSMQEKINIAIEAIKKYNCVYVQKDEEAFKNVAKSIAVIFNRPKPTVFTNWN